MAAALPRPSAAQTSAAPPATIPADPYTASFTVLLQGTRIGGESLSVTRTPSGWQLRGAGDLAPPFDVTTTRFEMDYGPDWQPQRLDLAGTMRGESVNISSSFGLTSASTDVVSGAQRGSVVHQITPRTVVLPNSFIAAYEALAVRLGQSVAGARVAVYIAPEGEITATVLRVTPRRIVTTERTFDMREFDLLFGLQAGPTPVQIWVDETNHLARVVLQANAVVAVRDDIGSVLTRIEKIRNAGDDDLFIPAAGFSLGATITAPVAGGGAAIARDGQAPAVILVPGAGPQDRDYSSYGVPIFGYLARQLSEAGYFVVRYDRRGGGQSGGRTENAGIAEYASDVQSIVTWLRRRDDVDEDRIAVIGYGEGGAVALAAADREKRIRAIGLVAMPGTPGIDATLDEQRRLLRRLGASEADQQIRIALQQQILDAVVSGRGWDRLPPAVRRQADTAWFRSWLQFDPARAIARVDDPILILHGAVDAEIPAENADRLEQYSRTRKRPVTYTQKVVLPDINHLMVRATTGEVDEYRLLPDLAVDPDVGAAIVAWLAAALPPR
jgi:pimeloyl-ACP methyl ester carboxylesterase